VLGPSCPYSRGARRWRNREQLLKGVEAVLKRWTRSTARANCRASIELSRSRRTIFTASMYDSGSVRDASQEPRVSGMLCDGNKHAPHRAD
jgi:hypothetical protein